MRASPVPTFQSKIFRSAPKVIGYCALWCMCRSRQETISIYPLLTKCCWRMDATICFRPVFDGLTIPQAVLWGFFEAHHLVSEVKPKLSRGLAGSSIGYSVPSRFWRYSLQSSWLSRCRWKDRTRLPDRAPCAHPPLGSPYRLCPSQFANVSNIITLTLELVVLPLTKGWP